MYSYSFRLSSRCVHRQARGLRDAARDFVRRLKGAESSSDPLVTLSVAVPRMGSERLNVPVYRARHVEFARSWFVQSANPVIAPDYDRDIELMRATFAAVPATRLLERLPKVQALVLVLAHDAGWVRTEITDGVRFFAATVGK